jgi:hypothetical protein
MYGHPNEHVAIRMFVQRKGPTRLTQLKIEFGPFGLVL